MNPFSVGARVRVKIVNRDEYAQGAAEALDGKTGTVDEVKDDGRTLVVFDTPAPKWWSNQTPCKAFWFLDEELEAL